MENETQGLKTSSIRSLSTMTSLSLREVKSSDFKLDSSLKELQEQQQKEAQEESSVLPKPSEESRKKSGSNTQIIPNAGIPVSIRTGGSSPKGRFLVASQDFQSGDLIFREDALISGPSALPSDYVLPVCLSCYAVVVGVQTGYKCENCKWPVCNQKCAEDAKHSGFECSILANHGISPDDLTDVEIITVLRCLLLRDKFPQRWSKLIELDSPQLDGCSENGNAVAMLCTALRFIHEVCDLEAQFDFDSVERVTRIVEMTGLASEDRQGGALFYRYGTYIYEYGSLLAHSCIPTAYRIINLNSQLELYASTPIKTGETITIAYAETFLGTWERRQFLRNYFYLSCTCARCSSPTECSTFFQAIKCLATQSCSSEATAFLLPLEPLNSHSLWQCQFCQIIREHDFITAVEESFRAELDDIDGDRSMDRVLKLEALAGKHRGSTLHPNHFLVIRTEYDIVQRMSFILYRNRIIRTQVEFVKRFVELTRKILSVFDILLPGFNRHRGRVLYFLQQGLLYLLQGKTNQQADNNNRRPSAPDDRSLNTTTQEFDEFLQVRQEGRCILMVEPEGSEEHLLSQEMLMENCADIETLQKSLRIAKE